MAKIIFTDRPVTPPPIIYCDASYLLDLYQANSRVRLSSYKFAGRATDGHGFYLWGRLHAVRFVVSMLALEEVYNAVLFSEIRLEASRRSLSGWKQLRATDAAAFAALLSRGRTSVQSFHRFFGGLGAELITVGRAVLSSDSFPASRISKYARVLLDKFELDGMDAYHIALARFCGVPCAATTDSDWERVPTIDVVTAA